MTDAFFTNRDGLNIAYRREGHPDHPPVVLIMGFVMQLTAWPEELCERLLAADLQVIRLDNRDIGLSDRVRGKAPGPRKMLARRSIGLATEVPYHIVDMAHDVVDLLDHLTIDRAHIVGASMGGMIAQRMAIHASEKVASLTSIMSTTGQFRYALPRLDVMQLMLTSPGDSLEERIEYGRRFWSMVGSPKDLPDNDELTQDLTEYYERSADLSGRFRQLAAISAERSRISLLRQITAPALVMHGLSDPLIRPEAGIATAKAIPRARFTGFNGMGHDLRPRFIPQICEHIIQHVEQAGV